MMFEGPTAGGKKSNNIFVGNKPTAAECGYKVGTTVWTAETCERWSVSEDNSVYYKDEQEKSSH